MTYRIYKTPFGWGGIVATKNGILVSILPKKNFGDVETSIEDMLPAGVSVFDPGGEIERLLIDFFEGKDVDEGMASVPLDLSGVTPFFQDVYRFARGIKRGHVLSYGEVAKMAGKSNSARAVGSAMAKNPVPPFIPCHRVVGGGGELRGFNSEDGIFFKERLLALEGIRVEKGRVKS